MKRTTLISLTLVVSMLTLGLLSSCSDKKKDPNARTDTYSSGNITFGADESFAPIIDEEMYSIPSTATLKSLPST